MVHGQPLSAGTSHGEPDCCCEDHVMSNLNKGTGEIPVTIGSVCTVAATGEFTVLGCLGMSVQCILGPVRVTDRMCRFRVPDPVNNLRVKCKPSVEWQCAEALYNGQEHPDPTPLEVPIGHQQPESLEASMQRFIKQEVAAHYGAQGAGSFEEEDDFDVPDEPDDPLSRYEQTEMQEEAPIVRPETVAPKETADGEDDAPPDDAGKPKSGSAGSDADGSDGSGVESVPPPT